MYRLLIAAIFLAGCAQEPAPTAPESGPAPVETSSWRVDAIPAGDVDKTRAPGMRYPLQLGNTWKHRAHVTMITIPDEGDPTELEIIRVTKSEITGAALYYGRCYVLEERTITEDVGDGEAYVQIVNYRQDREGLYEVADSSGGPVEGFSQRTPDRFALELSKQRQPEAWAQAFAATRARVEPLYAMRGGVLEGELTRLKYPLRPGQEWIVIEDPFDMSATVERHVTLDLPTGRTSAWKVRIESSLYGPDDVVHFFYGRDGYLGWQVSVVGEVTDESGNRIGTVQFTDEEYLEDLSIDRRGELPCEPMPAGGKTTGGVSSD